MDRAALPRPELALGFEVSAARAIPALIDPLLDPAVVVDPLDHLGDLGGVARVGGANEEVIAGVDDRHQLTELLGISIRELLRGDSLALGGGLDRLAVLVGSGQEEDVLAALAHMAGEHVGGHRRVRVAEMRLGVYVVDRGGQVVGHRGAGYFSALARSAPGRGRWRGSRSARRRRWPRRAGGRPTGPGGEAHRRRSRRPCRAPRRPRGRSPARSPP